MSKQLPASTGLSVILPNADPDAIEIGEHVRRSRGSIVDGVRHAIAAGQRLIAKKAALKAEFGHGSWLSWLEANERTLGIKARAANLLMKAAANPQLTADLNETTAFAISRKLWGNSVVPGTQGTGEFERYTPAPYADAARQVLGRIDLDPASCETAQRFVRADRYFTVRDDGLAQPWHGRVWLNPPYHRELAPKFVAKLIAELSAGRVTSAIMLTNNATDTEWFETTRAACAAICFTRGRIGFLEADGVTEVSPTQGQAFYYFGTDVQRFEEVFSTIGGCVRPSGVRSRVPLHIPPASDSPHQRAPPMS